MLVNKEYVTIFNGLISILSNTYGQIMIFLKNRAILAAILNDHPYIFPTHPKMRVYLNFSAHTHDKDSRKHCVINVLSRWHLAQSEAGLIRLV